MKLPNYLAGSWQLGVGEGVALTDPVSGETLAIADSQGMDLEAAMAYARERGNPALQKLTYRQRAELLAGIADVLTQNKSTYYQIARKNYGATPGDAAFDVDGAIFTLKALARAGKSLGEHVILIEGERVSLDKSGAFQGQHFLKPLAGLALFINAFNFPSWGLWEKAAPALLAGVPFLVKPATPTAWLTQRMVSDVVEAGVLPEGAISIVCGPARDLLDHIQSNDVVSFTGSAETAAMIRNHPKIVTQSVRVNIEADSLNSAIVGPDALAGSETFGLAVREIVRELTVKAGQKCTAIRRIFVPAAQADALTQTLVEKLGKVVTGNPRNESVRMGPLMNADQREAVQAGLQQLTQEARIVYGADESFVPLDAESDDAFMAPTLLRCDLGLDARIAHQVEVFGPVATIFTYDDVNQLVALLQRGEGSLVVSAYSDDAEFLATLIPQAADFHGRIMVVDAATGSQHTGHGNVMPTCLHGGPGRAGGGEELGGLRGLLLYHRRYVVQAGPALLSKLSHQAVDTSLLYT
jgi:3,4-dehydroadipyl-CoA semialdehyde dehydrogenase